jgi:DNA-binding response OmpR family regulator
MRILIIEDDPDIREALIHSLEAESFIVDGAADGEAGSYQARVNEYDLIILDLILPKKDGSQVCREIRESGVTCPILLLSVSSEIHEKINLLNYGADDYVTKPFSLHELIARIRALLRRPHKMESHILELADIKIDSSRQRVTRGSKEIYLTRKEFSLLEYLVRHRGHVISRGMIMEHVWNADSDPFSNTIEAHILNLRKKVDTDSLRKFIKTVPGRGYKIEEN